MPMKEYKININPRILELLGPNLYTNIYYVLAELVANAYDADAKNVYIIEESDSIRVEDDGVGMSYEDKDIERYLQVAQVSRNNDEDSRTSSGRLKMGRKGIGKLAALSVSEEVDVMTVKNGEKSGFVLARKPYNGDKLKAIEEKDINFKYVTSNGTAIVMMHPQYSLHRTDDAIKRNLLHIFPHVSSDFRIHLIRGMKETVISEFDRNIAKSLCALITLGNEYKDLISKVPDIFKARRSDLVKAEPVFEKTLKMQNNFKEEKEYTLQVEGWIGAYQTTKGRKKDLTDFPDNFISLFANKKLGEFNILPIVGKNKLNETYIVGQLYVDLFELSELPDMALSNRQGYKSDDPRYEAVVSYVRDTLLPRIINMRVLYTNLNNAGKKKEALRKLKNEEGQLQRNIEKFKKETSEFVFGKIGADLSGTGVDSERIQDIVDEAVNKNMPQLGIKSVIDSKKKKILISQNYDDKEFADLIYHFLLFNGAPAEDIIYSNCEDQASRIPEDMPIFEYLREFFVDSYSTTKIYTIFVTSNNTPKHMGEIAEIGAAWITGIGQKIFNLSPYTPQPPLNVDVVFQVSYYNEDGKLCMNKPNADVFCNKLEDVCNKLGYSFKSRQENKEYLEELVTITD